MGLISKFCKSEKLAIEREIAQSLKALLMTKEGFGAWQKGLGLSDYSYSTCCDEMVKKLLQDIQNNIVCFERRIVFKHISLISEMHVNPLRFKIDCTLEGKPISFYLSFRGSSFFQIHAQHEIDSL